MIIRNNKTNKLLIKQYIERIYENCREKIPVIKKKQKANTLSIENKIPNNETYNNLYIYNYTLEDLKKIAKMYKLKITGNKKNILHRIFSYLYLSNHIIKLQKIFRGFLLKKYVHLHGPAAFKRQLCVNDEDFVTLETLQNIPFHQFISYKDKNGFIYGFDISSLYNLFMKSDFSYQNPYTRLEIPKYVVHNIRSIIFIGKILKTKIHLNIQDDNIDNISEEKRVETRIVTLFQNMNMLGHNSDSQWFHSLNRVQLIQFTRELMEIWNYKVGLSISKKIEICPPYGNPFCGINIITGIINENNIIKLKNNILQIMEKLVNSASNNESKTLGCYYILLALTTVSREAANALPWLYESV